MADLSEDKKLVWLGLQNPKQEVSQVLSEFGKLQSEVGDYETYQSDLGDLSSHSDHNTYLQDNNFTSDEADAFTSKIQNNFDSWSAYKDYAQNEATTYPELRTQFNSAVGLTSEQEVPDGGPAAGVEIHDSAAISKNGEELEPGTVEIYGPRIEFSEIPDVVTDEATMTYSNLSVSDTMPLIGETFTVEATVENTGSAGGFAHPKLKIRSRVERDHPPISLDPGETATVTFQYSFDRFRRAPVSIGDLDYIMVMSVASDP